MLQMAQNAFNASAGPVLTLLSLSGGSADASKLRPQHSCRDLSVPCSKRKPINTLHPPASLTPHVPHPTQIQCSNSNTIIHIPSGSSRSILNSIPNLSILSLFLSLLMDLASPPTIISMRHFSPAATHRSKPRLICVARSPSTGIPNQRPSYPVNQFSKETVPSPFSLRQKMAFLGLAPLHFPDQKPHFIGYGRSQIHDKTELARSSETIVMLVRVQLRTGIIIINADFRSPVHIIPWVQ